MVNPSASELIVRGSPGVLRLTINRPDKRNALSLGVLEAIGKAVRRIGDDINVVTLRGTGDKAFAAGGDLRELTRYRSPQEAAAMSRRARNTLDALRECPVPVIAVLNGVTLGGGAELAVACDFRIAAASAAIGFVQGKLAVGTAWGGGAHLVDLLGGRRALRVLLEGGLLTAPEALATGLVDAVADAGESLEVFTERFVDPILRLRSQVVRAFKAVARSRPMGLPHRRAIELEHLVRTWTHSDHWLAADGVLAPGSRPSQ